MSLEDLKDFFALVRWMHLTFPIRVIHALILHVFDVHVGLQCVKQHSDLLQLELEYRHGERGQTGGVPGETVSNGFLGGRRGAQNTTSRSHRCQIP